MSWWTKIRPDLSKIIPNIARNVREFGSPAAAGKDQSMSRDWLAQLWTAEKRMTSVRRKARPRPQTGRVVPDNQAVTTMAEALSNFQVPSMTSILSRFGLAEQEAPVKKDVLQHEGGVVSLDYSSDKVLQTKLESLLARDNLLITRDIEWANIMFAFEQESRYVILDPCCPQAPVGSIREQSNVIYRQLLRTRRPFVAHVTDAMGSEIFTAHRPFWWINSTIYVEVDGKEVGVVRRRWHLWRRVYDLYLGNRQFAVVENPGLWNWTFTLKDDNDNVLAQIDRNWRGFGLEMFTGAGKYVIRFGETGSLGGLTSELPELLKVARSLTLPERALTVALAVSLDTDYFSRSGGWGFPLLIAAE